MLAVSGLTLGAQGIYQNANSPTDAICPRVEKDKTALNYGTHVAGTTGGMLGADSTTKLSYQQGQQFFPQGQRKSVAAFAAYDAKSKPTSIESLKGKVVLVGLWSTHCDPSAKMLLELASLYPKKGQFGFEILAVNFDENQQGGGNSRFDSTIEGGWRAINTFMNKNRQFFEVSKMPVYIPGLGKEGPSNFMDIVHSLPVLFVIDRDGNLAQQHIGYKEGFVGEAIKRAIVEKAQPPVPVAPAPAGGPTPS
ncbi:MAG: TlpA family protein disulfide reductase [Geothrix sp.]|uniref:TlpA disulfide reductase family protein n=1 Tax=Geothrix sp. TaxID=1962974 RepID=UPI0017DC6FEB|nr:TlpA disulfide reductase family protein [Geothrix sp.]NWJ40913.1 TlpA family protein disulfide reductase [Geothrix sp.]WIL21087.1 MAG: TlpA family protein disulfide reductase [Geothrix sp.]